MTVLCIGYEDKVSRLFWKIKRELSLTQPQINFKIYSIFLSGYLFSLFRLVSCSWVSITAWIQTRVKSKFYGKLLASESNYKGVDYKSLIQYHTLLDANISEKKLLMQALSYIDIFSKQIQKQRPEFALCWGDSRLAVEAFVAVCKVQKIKVYFLELGPYNTTFFDEYGVNANASVLKQYEKQQTKPFKQKGINHRTKKGTYLRNPILRSLDYIFELVFDGLGVYPPDMLRVVQLAKFGSQKGNQNATIQIESDPPVFLLVMQDPNDVNMVFHSPHFNSPFEILQAVHKNLPDNAVLIVREHPAYQNCNSDLFYDYIETNDIRLDSKSSLASQIQTADVIVVNNSTAGIEVLSSYKPLVVLGNAYYKLDAICLGLSQKEGIKELLSEALKYEVNHNEIDCFLEFLFNTYLISGSSDENPCVAAKSIAKILNHQPHNIQ